MSRISEVSAALVRVPLERPTSFSTREVLAREFVLVSVGSDDGHRGIGFTYGGNVGGRVTLEAVRALLRPVLIGEDPFRVEGLWEAMYRESLLQGRTGAAMRALSALDTRNALPTTASSTSDRSSTPRSRLATGGWCCRRSPDAGSTSCRTRSRRMRWTPGADPTPSLAWGAGAVASTVMVLSRLIRICTDRGGTGTVDAALERGVRVVTHWW